MRILFLSSWYPYPANNGSKLRLFNLIRCLSEHHQVSLFSFVENPPTHPPEELASICQEIIAVPRRQFISSSHRAALGLFRLTPRSIIDTYQPEVERQISGLLSRQPYDLIIASQWWMAAYWRAFGDVPALYEEVELGVYDSKVAQSQSLLEQYRHRITRLKLQYFLRRQLPHFRASTVVSDLEKSRLKSLVPAYEPVYVIPNGIDINDYRHYPDAPRPHTLIFTGSMTYDANLDGISWFINEVLHRVREHFPGVHLTVTGEVGDAKLPPTSGVTYTGMVEDVKPLVASSWVSLAPIRIGGGTRLKVLEALALGTPVVSTSKGIEGLEVRHDEHVLVADSAADFSDAVLRLLREPDMRQRLSEKGRQLVSQQYDWSVVFPQFQRVLDRVTGNRG